MLHTDFQTNPNTSFSTMTFFSLSSQQTNNMSVSVSIIDLSIYS